MRIESDAYVVIIEPVRVANRHERVRFHYTITRRSGNPMLLVSGSVATEGEATTLVQQYLQKFATMRSEVESGRHTSSVNPH